MLLIGLAVVIGIVLLQQVDDENDEARAGASTTTAAPKTTTTVPPATTTVVTQPATPPLAPDQLRLIVLNGGAPSGEAGRLSDDLKGKGYTNQPQEANNWSGRSQQGTSVLCKPEFQREALTLGSVIGTETQNEPYPQDPPSVIEDEAEVKCIVSVGS
jgi:hypothetical protein